MKFKANLKILYRWLFRRQKAYSQTGEDLIASYYLSGIKKGFYVDIGTNDPIHLNNTYLFYKQGWRGLCIEPNRQRCSIIRLVRPKDKVLCLGVGQQEAGLPFYVFDPDTLSTFSGAEAEKFKRLGYRLIKTEQVPVRPLKSILEEQAFGKEIDLLSIDTEGNDLEVLKSNDWQKFRPKMIIVEVVEHWKEKGIRIKKGFDEFLSAQGYIQLADTYINAIYVDKNYAEQTKLDLNK